MEMLLDGAASIAAVAIVFIIFLNDLLGGTLSPLRIQVLTVGTIVAVTLLTLASVHSNGILATVITTLKVVLVAGIGVAAFVFSDGSWAHYAASGAAGTCQGVPAGARLGINGFGAAMIGALWSYNGWADTRCVAAVPGLGIPAGSGSISIGHSLPDDQHAAGNTRASPRWPLHCRARPSTLCVLCAAPTA
jgi:APA family basic amino acid/polyamine antiporter